MRITSNMAGRSLLANLEKSETRLNQLQNQLSSSLRISKPSEDPIGVASILKLRSGLARVEQWKKNAGEGVAFMDTADTVMGEIGSAVQRVRELAVQGANGTLSQSERQSIKKEVDQIKEHLISLASSKLGDKPVFWGTKTATDPASPWNGNDQLLSVEVGNNLYIDSSINGSSVFQSTELKRKDGSQALGLIDTLQGLSDALGTNDSLSVNTILEDIDANQDNINLERADLGARRNRLTAAEEQLTDSSVNLRQNLSGLQDTDMAKTILDFASQQNVFKAALSTGAQIMQLSLVDYIK